MKEIARDLFSLLALAALVLGVVPACAFVFRAAYSVGILLHKL